MIDVIEVEGTFRTAPNSSPCINPYGDAMTPGEYFLGVGEMRWHTRRPLCRVGIGLRVLKDFVIEYRLGERTSFVCQARPTSRGENMSIQSQLTEALGGPATVFLRLALGVAFQSAVADRFGQWGTAGTKNVAWGDFAHFTQYVGQLNPWAPAALIPTLARVSTAAELVLGVALILGLFTRWAALLSGILLLLFAGGMSIGTGLKSALDASVFSAAAAAFALVVLGAGPWSVDSWRGG
jgi:thiosulfate dehydrogenase [quinone] large subunit